MTPTRLAIGVAALMLVGCYADAPIDLEPTMPVDSKILGTWWCSSGSDLAQLKIKAEGRARYAVTWKEPKRRRELYSGFTSSVGGRTVMNLKVAPKHKSDWPHPWTFFAIGVSDDVLHLQLIKEKVFSGRESSSVNVRATLESAIASGEAFNDDEPCRRSKEPVQ